MSRVVTLSGSVQVEVDRLVDELVGRIVAGVLAALATGEVGDRVGPYVPDLPRGGKPGYGEVDR